MKRAISAILSVLMAFTVLSGCGRISPPLSSSGTESSTKEAVSAGNSEEALYYNVGTLPIVNEEITLHLLAKEVADNYSLKDAAMWEYYTEKTGINFEIEAYSGDEMKTKLTLILSTNQKPDILWQAGIGEADVLSYGQQNILLNLDDYIDKYATYTKEVFEKESDAKAAASSSDGHIYALPAYNYSVKYWNNVLYMNKNWLANVGMEAPTTLDELYDVLKAFKEKDADGNGDANNEIPTYETADTDYLFLKLLEAVGFACIWPHDGDLYSDRDGEVFLIQTTDEYKFLMRYMNKLFSEGLIDPNSYTQSQDELDSKKFSNTYGMRVDVSSIEGPVSDMDQYNPDDWTVLQPLTSAMNSTPITAGLAQYQTCMGAICADTEYPEAAFLFLDWCYSPDASAIMNGEKNYLKLDNSVSDEVKQLIAEKKDAGPEALRKLIGTYGPRWQRREWVDPASFSTIMQDNLAKCMPYITVGWQNNLKFTDTEAEVISIYSTDLGVALNEWRSFFITGKKNVDTDWEEYMAVVESMHPEKLVEVYQAAYDRYMDK